MPWLDAEPSPPLDDDDAVSDADVYFDAPAGLIEPSSEGRLIWPLRAAARTSPETMLALSAATLALWDATRILHSTAARDAAFPPTAAADEIVRGGLALVPRGRASLARAYADLALTGRRAYRATTESPPDSAAVAAHARRLCSEIADVSAESLEACVDRALSRAESVGEYFRAALPDRRRRRPLGWIAVSAEDDAPRRPVNVAASPFPQYDLTVPVSTATATVKVEARYAIISNHASTGSGPQIPADDVVVLFLHGDGSRLEEGGGLIGALLDAGARNGVSYTVLAVDLPSHGYSSMVDPLGPAFAGSPEWDNSAPVPPQRPSSYPMLEFLESFLVSFVETLDARLHFAHQLVGPMGGSLGGALSLRLARRREPWMRQAIAWSPASVWNSLANDLVKQAGPNHVSTEGHLQELAGTRSRFMYDVFESQVNFGPIPIVWPQGEYWYRRGWRDKEKVLRTSRRERQEVYNQAFRQWHYRMDWEQLLYSFNDPDPGHREPRFKSFRARVFLAAGGLDDSSPCTQIYRSTRALARELARTQIHGRSFFLERTGHSMHHERPALLAAEIDAFTRETIEQ